MYKPTNERTVCRDGFSVSIQGSRTAYCSPRCDYPPFGYSEVEVGFPSCYCSEIAEFAEGRFVYCEATDDMVEAEDINYTKTVYPYVPVENVIAMLEKHGGVVSGELPQLNTLKLSQKVFVMIYEDTLNLVLLSDIHKKWKLDFPLQTTREEFDSYTALVIAETNLKEVSIKSVKNFCKLFEEEVF